MNLTAASQGSACQRRILIVGMHNSIHVQRWARMIARDDVAVLVFPVFMEDIPAPADFRHISLSELSSDLGPGLWMVRSTLIYTKRDTLSDLVRGYRVWRHSFLTGVPVATPGRLRECIERFRPELVHSMEVQVAGYLCLETARRMAAAFPPWILSNWGSDIALFRKLGEHQPRIQRVCQRIDYYLAECRRDQTVAQQYGYRGPLLPVIPASGGADVAALSARAQVPPSRRRVLLVKGYHNWSGRALIALSALALAHRHLSRYRIEVPLFSGPVIDWVERLRTRFGLEISTGRYFPDHSHALDRLAEARVVLGVGISDGISTTLLEAMAVGTLPIQSSTACADEWLEHGRSGFIVSPYDTEAMANSVIEAVTNDALVDEAAAINRQTVMARWNFEINGQHAWDIYDRARTRS
jgi:2-hydroxychromene-2-carboxylate isomerase